MMNLKRELKVRFERIQKSIFQHADESQKRIERSRFQRLAQAVD